MLQFILKLLGFKKEAKKATVAPFKTVLPVRRGKEGIGHGRIKNVEFDNAKRVMYVTVALSGNRPLVLTGKNGEFKAERMVSGWPVHYTLKSHRLNIGNAVNIQWKEA